MLPIDTEYRSRLDVLTATSTCSVVCNAPFHHGGDYPGRAPQVSAEERVPFENSKIKQRY